MTERIRVALCLYDDDKRVLMQHRSADAHHLQNYWTFFGGHVDGEEKPEYAIHRIVFEEVDYRPHKPELLMKEKGIVDGIHVMTLIYVEPYDGVQRLVLHKGQDYGWFSIEEALALNITPECHETLLRLQEYLESA